MQFTCVQMFVLDIIIACESVPSHEHEYEHKHIMTYLIMIASSWECHMPCSRSH
jgi:hypothetical protein